VGCPDPDQLRARFRSGREGFLQLLVASLVVGGTPPKWNQPNTVTERGRRWLTELIGIAGLPAPDLGDEMLFVNEFELPRRHDSETAGWPDFAVLCRGSLLLIELKTEPDSHLRGQLARYTDQSAHHHPDRQRALIYITPSLRASASLDPVPTTHLLWPVVSDMLTEVWSGGSPDETCVLDYARDLINHLGERWVASGSQQITGDSPEPVARLTTVPPAHSGQLIELAARTAADGKQRAAEIEWTDPQRMEDLRLQVRNELIAGGSPVRPWIWSRRTSGGTALTDGGRVNGYELRLSCYRTA
jgi:hypothetical protein